MIQSARASGNHIVRLLAFLVFLLLFTPVTHATPAPLSMRVRAARSLSEPGQACLPPFNPATAADLNEAIACVNAAGEGTHTISLAADITLEASTTPLDNPQATQLIVQGNGHTLDGAGSGTIFTIEAGTIALINHVTLTGGQGARGEGGGWGGGIFNRGELTLTNSTLSGNMADFGGGITNFGDGAIAEMTISDTTISGNAAVTAGGGISNLGANGGTASLTIVNSTLSGNEAAIGGGIYSEGAGGNAGAVVVLTTLAENIATGGGGGIHVTKSDVNALPGNSSVLLNGTIISKGLGSSPNCARVNGGALISQGFNLADDDSCNLTQPSDWPSAIADLLPLEINPPGTSATHALGFHSQAVDRIPYAAVGCGTEMLQDQRDEPRPYPNNGLCDIGAFERGVNDSVGYTLFLPVGLDTGP